MAAVLATRYPEKSPELWAYQTLIVRAALNFEATAWVTYDRQYRRDVLARRDLNWLQPNSRLYNEAFTCCAKEIPHCHLCLSDAHSSSACTLEPTLEPTLGSGPTNVPSRQPYQPSQEVCRLYNTDRCHHPRCRRYHHVCQECSYQHPWTQYPKNWQNSVPERSFPPTGRVEAVVHSSSRCFSI